VKLGGGVETVCRYLRAGLIGQLHLALSPVVLGQGEAMVAGIDLPALGYRVTENQATERATRIVLSR
jgi:dihydrofolate reductase